MQRLKLLRMKTEKSSQQSDVEDLFGVRKSFLPMLSLTNRKEHQKYLMKNPKIQRRTVSRSKVGRSINFVQNRYSFACHRTPTQTHKRMSKKSVDLYGIKTRSAIRTNLLNNKGRNGLKDYAWNSYRGNKEQNEDRVNLHLDFQFAGRSYVYFAIFDGHGGSSTSEFLYNNLFRLFQKQIKNGKNVEVSLQKALTDAENRLETLFKANKRDKSGSCALVCVYERNSITIANVGDSRAILLEGDEKLIQLTNDHKPENEITRIQSLGGKVYRMTSQFDKPIGPFRVWPGKLSVSRTIGDIFIKQQELGETISSVPEIVQYKLSRNSKLILMSDGAYESLSNQQICSFFHDNNVADGIDKLILSSIVKGSMDNLSIIAADLS